MKTSWLAAPAVTVRLVPEAAELAEPSVTTTDFAPTEIAGTVKVTAEEPFVPLVAPPVIVAGVPPTVTVRAELAAKPVAEIDTEPPSEAEVGLSPVAAALTVKLVPEVALLVPSETTIAWAPFGTAGTVKVRVAEPVASVGLPPVTVA
ncbi:MAG TPA: hypothetical protein VNF07_07835, partial [Acidimicrobiales bacterium]|nr:hypothetical protein [Acidimicrobiales bacterium]